MRRGCVFNMFALCSRKKSSKSSKRVFSINDIEEGVEENGGVHLSAMAEACLKLKWLERFTYVYHIYPVTAIPLLMYCALPAVCPSAR
ncbi:hypothetical protein V6N13_004488 [Hibiscus sabdariffa]